MPTPPLSKDTIDEAYRAWVENNKNTDTTAKKLGIARTTLQWRLQKHDMYADKERQFSVPRMPDDDMSPEQIVEWRKKQFEKKRAHEEARKLIPVKILIDGPYGILHFGDPHVDDDGTDIGLLEKHIELCRSVEGLFAANVGDVTNNWVGRLAKLYGEQSTSSKQAWMLAEWLIKKTGPHLLYLVGGNHDGWSGEGDPLKWICKQVDALYQSSEVRMELQSPGGHKIRVNCRHDFSGHSQYNPAHGPTKSVLFGVRDHIAICGHRHKSGYNVIKDPDSGITSHAIQVASYKIYDRYARSKGFRDQTLSPCCVTVVDPYLPGDHPDMIKVFWDASEGAEFLKWKRKRVVSAGKKSR